MTTPEPQSNDQPTEADIKALLHAVESSHPAGSDVRARYLDLFDRLAHPLLAA